MIRQARESKGITQQHLAELMGVSKQQIINWETKKNRPNNPQVIKWLAELLEVDYKELIFYFYLLEE